MGPAAEPGRAGVGRRVLDEQRRDPSAGQRGDRVVCPFDGESARGQPFVQFLQQPGGLRGGSFPQDLVDPNVPACLRAVGGTAAADVADQQRGIVRQSLRQQSHRAHVAGQHQHLSVDGGSVRDDLLGDRAALCRRLSSTRRW